MGFFYFLFALYQYVLPLVILAGLYFVIRTVLRGRWWRDIAALVVVAGVSAYPTLQASYQIDSDLKKFAGEEVRPDVLALDPGRLLLIQPSNHAGLSCGFPCETLTQASFVTELIAEYDTDILQLGTASDPLGIHDLWDGLRLQSVQDSIDRTGPFPYEYAFISVESWRFPDAQADGAYRMAHWPGNGKGVHMLVSLPPDGILDLQTAQVHYRRFNIQDTLNPFPFMGFATETIQTPTVDEIMQEVVALSKDVP